MKVLIKKARISNSKSPYHGKVKDILISAGTISAIEDNIDADEECKVIDHPNIHVSEGWVDVFADFAEPGGEHRETVETGLKAAGAGGFTDVFIIPNTKPAIDNKSQVEFLKNRSVNTAVTIHPIGSITKGADGKELAEMYDMHKAGAIAFSDGIAPLQNAAIMLKAMQYVVAKNSIIIQIPDNKDLSSTGLVNEGIVSTRMGLPGKPAIAEELMVMRDIELLKYTRSKLHFTGISTAKSLQLINKARHDGLNISCSVTPYHLTLCDEDLKHYDCNLKVNNPLRTRADMESLREAFFKGEIDCIATHHLPQHSDNKDCEFEYAKYGMIGLQTAFPLFNHISKATDTIIQMLADNVRNIFGIESSTIDVNNKACLTMYAPEDEYVFTKDKNLSKSHNSPYFNIPLKGKVIGIYNKNILQLNG